LLTPAGLCADRFFGSAWSGRAEWKARAPPIVEAATDRTVARVKEDTVDSDRRHEPDVGETAVVWSGVAAACRNAHPPMRPVRAAPVRLIMDER
jgi:hypothetical protein